MRCRMAGRPPWNVQSIPLLHTRTQKFRKMQRDVSTILFKKPDTASAVRTVESYGTLEASEFSLVRARGFRRSWTRGIARRIHEPSSTRGRVCGGRPRANTNVVRREIARVGVELGGTLDSRELGWTECSEAEENSRGYGRGSRGGGEAAEKATRRGTS